ncbi:hypothetical protein WR25_21969 [Diploscapter pachys]|uniref:Integrase catalytic domain-containing protein n=1 Tax=Diploscapter pachys TaxID=2018661 RepID=A0A2A2LL48_9BILA|nr:hypothetical protein WR25_21969 [Diploscapter pachys]
MGGFWERLVASVKQAFQKSFGKQPLSMDAMQTAVVEIEGILNGRPLTYMSPEALTQLRPMTPTTTDQPQSRLHFKPGNKPSSHYRVPRR